MTLVGALRASEPVPLNSLTWKILRHQHQIEKKEGDGGHVLNLVCVASALCSHKFCLWYGS